MMNRVSPIATIEFTKKSRLYRWENWQQSKRENENEISRKTDKCLRQANKFSVYCTDLTDSR